MKKNDFAIFILSHGRANNQRTIDTLKRLKYSGKLYIVLDNEDEQEEEYKRLYGEQNIIIFDKSEEMKHTDVMNNFQNHKLVVYARNRVNDIAKELGLKYYLVLDDDYVACLYRFTDGKSLYGKRTTNFWDLCNVMIKWLESSPRMKCVAFAQGGDLLGGATNDNFIRGWKRKVMNTFFCSVDKPLEFMGEINEDANMYCVAGNRGDLFYSTCRVSITQLETQSNSGGLTDIYLQQGTYVKSFYTVMCCPSFVKVRVLNSVHARVHHGINSEYGFPKIIREEFKKKA